ncbi:hypothetical protein BC827DRAFT_1219902, partial [Russula dissimulans]
LPPLYSQKVQIAAMCWTAWGNLIVTTGPSTPSKVLHDASPHIGSIIHKAFQQDSSTPSPPEDQMCTGLNSLSTVSPPMCPSHGALQTPMSAMRHSLPPTPPTPPSSSRASPLGYTLPPHTSQVPSLPSLWHSRTQTGQPSGPSYKTGTCTFLAHRPKYVNGNSLSALNPPLPSKHPPTPSK